MSWLEIPRTRQGRGIDLTSNYERGKEKNLAWNSGG